MPEQDLQHLQAPDQAMHSAAPNAQGVLYVVATPIGNLRDISARALDVLREVDLIAAEDTRNTGVLLKHYAIAKKMIPLHEHNEQREAQKLTELLRAGKSIALVSDAGTPGISDPGMVLVDRALDAGVRVIPMPGANAAIAALSVSGMATQHFLFYGFLPAKRSARKKALGELRSLPYPLIFYEAPHRIEESIIDLQECLAGTRQILFARELTKLFEEIHRCELSQALTWVRQDANRLKGEYVLIVGADSNNQSEDIDPANLEMLRLLLEELPLKQAVSLAARISGKKRNELYTHALTLKDALKDKTK